MQTPTVGASSECLVFAKQYADQSTYEGGYSDGKKHGVGVYTTADGETFSSQFHYGEVDLALCSSCAPIREHRAQKPHASHRAPNNVDDNPHFCRSDDREAMHCFPGLNARACCPFIRCWSTRERLQFTAQEAMKL